MFCFVVVMQSVIMNSHEVFIHIHQGCFTGIGAIVRLPQCQWSKSDGYGKISQCITTTKHSKAKTVCIFHGIYCKPWWMWLFVTGCQWALTAAMGVGIHGDKNENFVTRCNYPFGITSSDHNKVDVSTYFWHYNDVIFASKCIWHNHIPK